MDSEKALGLHVLALPTPRFLSFSPSLFLPLRLILCTPIDYQKLLSTLGYITSSPQRVFAAPTVGGSPAGLILNKGEGLELVVLLHSREVCVPGTRLLQHAVTSLQPSPPLMLPDR